MNDCELGEYDLNTFSRDLDIQAAKKLIPLYGTFELTARCNFSCKMCYVHLTNEQANAIGKELTNEEWLNIAKEAKNMGMLYLTLTGGEVFTRPGFKDLYIELSKMGFLITILTNGYLITEKEMEWLKEYPPFRIRFTLYGISNETYQKVCGVRDGFDRVDHAIDLILDAKIPFSMVGTIIDLNEPDLMGMYEYAKAKNVSFKHTIAVVKSVRGATNNVGKHRFDLEKAPKELLDQIKKGGVYFDHSKLPAMDCGLFRKGFTITWNGKVTLCSFINESNIDITQHGFSDSWKMLNNNLMMLKKPEKCVKCKYEMYCSKCIGKMSAECGNYSEPDDAFCEQAKFLYRLLNREENL